MPSEGSGEVADDSVATETPAGGAEAVASAAEDVEQSAPLPAGSIAEASTSWADLSEVQAPAPSGFDSIATDSADQERSLVEVKEEIHEAESISAVISAIGLPEEVVDDPVATEETGVDTSLQDQSFLEPPSDLGNPAEAAFTDIDRAKEEEEVDPQQDSSTLLEQADEIDTTDFADPAEEEQQQVESADLLGLGDEAGPVGEASGASEPSASVPEPAVADTSGVATEANTSCPDQIVPPPTSPNLVEPGTEPIQVGHSPATSSNPPRQRVRSSRGGATTRWQEAKRACWNDFEAYQNWLYHNSGGDIVGGFWLRKIPYEQADESTRWLIALHSRLVEEFPTSQCLALAYQILIPYKEWAHIYGLDRRRGISHGEQVINSGELPPKKDHQSTYLRGRAPAPRGVG